MSAEQHDLVVIGSGFGGATFAARLVESGARVTLLERGPWRANHAVQAAGLEGTAPLPTGRHFFSHALRRLSASILPGGEINLHRDALFDLHYQRDMSIVASSGVGGGSHVYSAMNVCPDQSYWQKRHDDIDPGNMAEHYNWILSRTGSRAPDDSVPNMIVADRKKPSWMHAEAAYQPAMGFRFQQGSFSNNSFFGSADNSKISLDELLLLPLLERGLTVRDRHEVLEIHQHDNGLRLAVMDHGKGKIRTLICKRVVLAAGTLNTLKLLFRSRERGGLDGMQALGLGIGGNGDVPAWWPCNEAGRDFSVGTPCHGRFSIQGESDGPNLTRYGLSGIDGIPMPGTLRRRLKRDLVLVGMGADSAPGLACWTRQRLRIAYSQSANPVLADIYRAFERISALSGRKVRYLRSRPITVHPWGGARIGNTPQDGVIQGDGQVHGIPGLYVADATALPAAPGVPPSMTIAAWAGHVAQGFIRRT